MWVVWPGVGWRRLVLFFLYPPPAIARGIAIDNFIVLPRVWYAHPVAVARHRGEIAHKHERLVLFLALAHKGRNTIIRVMHINPGEPCRVIIQQAQRRFFLVKLVQVA